MRIRTFDPVRDRDFLRRCVVELQETERALDRRLPPGEEMADAYVTVLLARAEEWRGELLVAEEEGREVGLVAIYHRVPETEPDEPPGTHALITDLVVLPEARRGGIGSALLEAAIARARASGVDVVRLEVMADNLAARRFYREHGWRERLVQLQKEL